MTIDPRRLLHFLAVARLGTFGKAAHALNLSQPALSKSIAAFERSVGSKLLDRSRQGASLTPAGRHLMSRAEALHALLDATSLDLTRFNGGLDGTLRIGVSPVACVAFVPDAVAALAQEFPTADISVEDLPDDRLRKDLVEGRLDVVVSPVDVRGESPLLDREQLFGDRLVLAVAPPNALARRKSVRLCDVAAQRFVMPRKGTAMHGYVEALFVSSNVAWPARCVSTNSLPLIKSMVRNDAGIAIVSDRLIEPEVSAGLIVAVDLRDFGGTRDVFIRRLRNAPKNPLVDRFVVLLRDRRERVSAPRSRPRGAIRRPR